MADQIIRPIPMPSPGTIEVAVVVTAWNRPGYLARCLSSLASSDLRGAAVIIVDDGSDDPRTLRLIEDFRLATTPIFKIYRRGREDCGPNVALATGWDLAVAELGCLFLVNLDSDIVTRPDWLVRMRTQYQALEPKLGPFILTGFHAFRHRVKANHAQYRVKRSIGGANVFFNRALFDSLVRPSLTDGSWDWKMVNAARERGCSLVTTRPSVVQHIGIRGLWSGPTRGWDFALDYWIDVPALEWGLRRADSVLWAMVKRLKRRS